MKHSILFILSGALALACSAQTLGDVEVTVPGKKAAPVVATYKMWPEELKPFKGEYFLSNGMTLFVTGQGRRMFAQVDRQTRREVVATAPGKFVALDRKLSMHIDLKDNGDVGGELSFVNEAAATAAVGETLEPVWAHVAMH